MVDSFAQPTLTQSRQSVAAQGRTAPGKVTGKLKVALDLMVWKGLKRSEAAQEAGLADHSVREAFKRPHVKAYYLAGCEELRLSGRAKRLHRLEALAEQDENRNAAVAAIKAAEQIGDGGYRGAPLVAGLQIVILQRDAAPRPSAVPMVIEAHTIEPGAVPESIEEDDPAPEHPESARQPPKRSLAEARRIALSGGRPVNYDE